MTIDTLIMLAGAVVALLPFLGLPNSWDRVIFFIAGVIVIALGIVVRRKGVHLATRRKMRDPHFVDTEPQESSLNENEEGRTL